MAPKTLNDILDAKTPEELFGRKEDPKRAQKRFTALLRLAHPDMNLKRSEDAQKAFIIVNEMWHKFNGTTKAKANSVKTKRHEYTFEDKRYQADGVAYFEATYDAGHEETIIAFSTTPAVNSLFTEATRNLRTIRRDVPDDYKAFFPEVVDIFSFQNGTNNTPAVALKGMNRMFSLREVLEDYPDGIDGKDVAWIFRRMLIALGNTHDAGYIHGGANLDSFVIFPELHGLVLKDWQYSVPVGEPAKALAKKAKDIYPAYVFEGEPLKAELDIQMAARTALLLLEDAAPKRVRTFLKSLSQYPMKVAAEALYEFDEMLVDVYGGRKFHEFKMRRA